MQLSRQSRLVQWAYLGECYRPTATSLCALFWRIVLLSPLKVLTPLVFLAAAGVMVWNDPRGSLWFTAMLLGVFTLVCGLSSLPWAFNKVGRTVVGQGFKAVKGRVCPIVRID